MVRDQAGVTVEEETPAEHGGSETSVWAESGRETGEDTTTAEQRVGKDPADLQFDEGARVVVEQGPERGCRGVVVGHAKPENVVAIRSWGGALLFLKADQVRLA